MPHRDTSVATKQAINRALMPRRDKSVAIKQVINRALYATHGHKPIYQTSYQLSLPN